MFAKSSNSFTLHLHIEVDGVFKNKSKSNCSLFGISQINHDTINLKLTGFLWREREIQQNFCFSVFCYNIFISLAPTRIASGIKSYTRFIFVNLSNLKLIFIFGFPGVGGEKKNGSL